MALRLAVNHATIPVLTTFLAVEGWWSSSIVAGRFGHITWHAGGGILARLKQLRALLPGHDPTDRLSVVERTEEKLWSSECHVLPTSVTKGVGYFAR